MTITGDLGDGTIDHSCARAARSHRVPCPGTDGRSGASDPHRRRSRRHGVRIATPTTMTIANSTIERGRSSRQRHPSASCPQGTLSITNSTISGNTDRRLGRQRGSRSDSTHQAGIIVRRHRCRRTGDLTQTSGSNRAGTRLASMSAPAAIRCRAQTTLTVSNSTISQSGATWMLDRRRHLNHLGNSTISGRYG